MSKPKRRKAPTPKPSRVARPRGRPTLFDKAMGEKICELLVEHRSLVKVSTLPGMPKLTTMYRWEDEGIEEASQTPTTDKAAFSAELARAKKWQARAIFEDAMVIADDDSKDLRRIKVGKRIEVVTNSVAVARSRLRYDSRLAVAARLDPTNFAATQKLANADGKNLPASPSPLNVTINGPATSND